MAIGYGSHQHTCTCTYSWTFVNFKNFGVELVEVHEPSNMYFTSNGVSGIDKDLMGE